MEEEENEMSQAAWKEPIPPHSNLCLQRLNTNPNSSY
jgi:hypothetical protein